VKHACKLVKRCVRASLRSRSANSRQIAIEARATSGASIWLNQPKCGPGRFDAGRQQQAHLDRAAYADRLKQLHAVCTERGIVLIFDEVFVGFRLAPGGALDYFGVRPDLVTYGKTLGGGLPIGAVCGKKHLMNRFHEDRQADICFARHVQLASLRDGGDERIPAEPRRTGDLPSTRSKQSGA
jgi:hypothetical protein